MSVLVTGEGQVCHGGVFGQLAQVISGKFALLCGGSSSAVAPADLTPTGIGCHAVSHTAKMLDICALIRLSNFAD
jgi:hypothetical protein